MQTERDAKIVDWIGRFGAVGIAHVVHHFSINYSVAARRLRSLARDGLLKQHEVLFQRPSIYTATRAGLRWQGLTHLGVRKVNPGGFEHAWQLAQTAVDLEMRLPGWEVLSERELRAIEAENEKLFASVQVGQIAGRPQMHRPDLVLVSSSGRVVPVEVELSHKAPSRLDAICRGWARARHIEIVYYLTAPRPTRALERSARRVNALDRITVLPVEDTAGLAERELAIERTAAPAAQEFAGEEATDVSL